MNKMNSTIDMPQSSRPYSSRFTPTPFSTSSCLRKSRITSRIAECVRSRYKSLFAASYGPRVAALILNFDSTSLFECRACRSLFLHGLKLSRYLFMLNSLCSVGQMTVHFFGFLLRTVWSQAMNLRPFSGTYYKRTYSDVLAEAQRTSGTGTFDLQNGRVECIE